MTGRAVTPLPRSWKWCSSIVVTPNTPHFAEFVKAARSAANLTQDMLNERGAPYRQMQNGVVSRPRQRRKPLDDTNPHAAHIVGIDLHSRACTVLTGRRLSDQRPAQEPEPLSGTRRSVPIRLRRNGLAVAKPHRPVRRSGPPGGR